MSPNSTATLGYFCPKQKQKSIPWDVFFISGMLVKMKGESRAEITYECADFCYQVLLKWFGEKIADPQLTVGKFGSEWDRFILRNTETR